jgi:probable rRNA maturation factor
MSSAEPSGLELQVVFSDADLPGESAFARWAQSALHSAGKTSELMMTVRLVGDEESGALNEKYRRKQGPTNVLAFPGPEDSPDLTREFGDLVICVPLVRREALEQGKDFTAHLAHLVVHGTLHLAGYDHDHAEDADRMECLETLVMDKLGFPNPYE